MEPVRDGMYHLLQFMDSFQVREYNRETYFTPAEWALIVANSIGRTVEEKLNALQYLTKHYGEEEFAKESVNVGSGHTFYHSRLPSVEDIRNTMRVWKEMLGDRYHGDGFIYAAVYEKKERIWSVPIETYRFFSEYEKAFMHLKETRDKKREGKFFCQEDFFGEIRRFKPEGRNDWDIYIFDGGLRMVELIPNDNRIAGENGSYTGCLDDPEMYQVFVPLPFKKGDIIKVESSISVPYYGVMCCDWKCPEGDRMPDMWLPLDIYDEAHRDFDYVDGGYSDILSGVVCPEEELPKNEQMLKQISAVYKGQMDYMELLGRFSKREI